MAMDISFKIEEIYNKVGFDTHDDFTATIYGLSKGEAEWLRGQVMQLIHERRS